MMKRTIHLIAMLLTVMVSQAQTSSAEEYFNLAARQYVKEDKLAALKTLDKGLQAHPGDARMLKLAEELLKEQQQQQQAQQQQQKQQDEQQKKEEQDQQKAQQEQQKKEQQEQERAQQGEREDGRKKPQPGRIAPQDAERILDALERQEQGTQDKVRARMRPVQRRRIEKDW
ncbi:MAG: hypothetical protein KA941_08000 [Flavobacteriales bacterium]|nr:hypothetical protein [Flavobacteriales bacterium]